MTYINHLMHIPYFIHIPYLATLLAMLYTSKDDVLTPVTGNWPAMILKNQKIIKFVT